MFLKIAPIAFFWAFSPVIVSVVVLLLTTAKPVRNTLAFTLPSVFGSMLVGVILVVVLQGKDFSPNSNASNLTYVAQLVTAAIFFLVLLLIFWKLPKGSKDMKMPKWVRSLDRVSPRTALVFGSILFLNNVFLTITAVADILLAKQSVTTDVITIVVFVLVGTLGLWVPLTYKIISPEKSTPNFELMREWLIIHNRGILVFEFAFLGVLELVKGIVGLLH